MKKYKVLWFDDEHKSLESIKEDADIQGIQLIGFTNAAEGILELRAGYKYYDAVIVDGKFFNTPSESTDEPDDSAFREVAFALEQLKDKKSIPWFILSGQISFTKETNKYAEVFKDNKVYDKVEENDLENLWQDIKTQASQQEETNIRHRYQRVFDVCTDEYIGKEAESILFDAIKILEDANEGSDTATKFGVIRLIVEKIFSTANRIGILPDDIIQSKGWINGSSRFLAGKHPDYPMDEGVFPKLISDRLWNTLDLLQDGSHSEGKLKLEVIKHVEKVKNPYLYKGVVYQLIDILIWFKDFIDEHPDKDINQAIWHKEPAWVEGTIININLEKKYAFLQLDSGGDNIYIPAYILNKTNVNINERVLVQIKEKTEYKPIIKTEVSKLKKRS